MKATRFNPQHFKAVFFRRWVLLKRSWRQVLNVTLASLFFAAITILAQYLISTLEKEDYEEITFDHYDTGTNILVVLVEHEETELEKKYINELADMYHADTGRDADIRVFRDKESMNDFVYNSCGKMQIPLGIWLRNTTEKITDFVLLFNSTTPFGKSKDTQPFYGSIQLTRLKWKHLFGNDNDFSIRSVKLTKRSLEKMFGQLGPMLITGSLISNIPLFVSQPVIDIQGEVRQYMTSCTLSIIPYWIATFMIDMVVWIVNSFLVWLIFIIFQVRAFLDNKINTLYAFFMCGPSFLLFVYVTSFCFATAESASRLDFIFICIFLLVPIIVDVVRQEVNPIWLEWTYALFPNIIVQRILMAILTNMGAMTQSLDYYFKSKQHQAFFIMQFANIPIYSAIIYIIEKVRVVIMNRHVKKSYGNYVEFFNEQKKLHPVTQEARDMEYQVKGSSDYAVRIIDVSRLFFNTKNEPVSAVNEVSLGIKRNSIFGFLGANGAGKTTLIKMITSMLPASTGIIEINGVDITKFNDPTLLSICPQFNKHLCEEMTPNEHFKMYSWLHRLDPNESKEKVKKLINELEMDSFKDVPLRELSGGDVRKVSIALTFLAPAEIILLDEPTASLDPIACHRVHEMILSYKGQKTFMLCTHLLSEAEFLCDMISMMIKGCVYTCGSAQYLTQKFGTDYRIDILLQDESASVELKCDNFFSEKLPDAVLSIVRPKARIYSIPSSSMELPDLFEIMQNATPEDTGIIYFTCSSSSLERVFMELIHMSESDDMIAKG